MKYAFTLLELLVVILILTLLAGLSLTGINILRNHSHQVRDQALISDLANAIQLYLSDYGMIGDSSTDQYALDAREKILQFLHARPLKNGKSSYYVPRTSQIAKGLGSYSPCALEEAEFILDSFRKPLIIEVFNGQPQDTTSFKINYTQRIRLIAEMGTPGKLSDDIIMTWESDTGSWTRSVGR